MLILSCFVLAEDLNPTTTPIQENNIVNKINDHTDKIAKSIEDGVKTYGNELLTTIRSMVIKASIYMIFFYFGVSLFVQMLVNFISIRQQKKILISMANDIIKIRRELEENKQFLKDNYVNN